MARIVVVEGPDKGKYFPVESDCVTVGRGQDCEVILSDQAVSRRHCQLLNEGDRWIVVDLKSSNRTFLNDDPIDSMPLKGSDLIGVGDSELRLEFSEDEIPQKDLNTTILKEFRLGEDHVANDGHIGGKAVIEKLSFLSRFGRVSEGAKGSRDLLNHTLKALLPVLQAQWAVALLRGKQSWKTVSRAGARVKSAFSKTLLDELLKKKQSVLCANVVDDPVLSGSESIIASRVQSVVTAPLQCREELIGALYFAKREGEFPPEDIFFVSVVCNQIALLLDNFLKNEALEKDRENLLSQIQDKHKIIGKSVEIDRVLNFISRAAPSDATVLIRGETGTGKELVASALHYASNRAGKPFVEINCAAIPEQLLESELFGHEKGAFTGAVLRKKGRFEIADGGTVFLDEIGELSPACQAKVLRVIEERRFERVGGVASIEVDVRIVAATNRDLQRAVEENKFREDLYWRLDVLHVELPTLKERPSDVPLLSEYFLGKLAGPKGKILKLSPEACEALKQYNWPGNVRQLKNVLENAVIMSTGSVINKEDLRLINMGEKAVEVKENWKPESLVDLEKEHILRVLQWTKGNKKQAAEILGIERCTLYSRLKTYGYKLDSFRSSRK